MSIQALRHSVLSLWHDKRPSFFRLGIILGVVFSAPAIGWLMAQGRFDPPMILAAAGIGLGVLVLYRLRWFSFEHGILAVALAGCLVNFFTLPTGTQSRIVVSLAVALGLVVAWLLQFLVGRSVPLKPSPINKPVLMFAAVNLIAYAWSNVFRDAMVYVWRSFPIVQVAALVVNILLPVLTLLVSNKLGEIRWLKQLTWVMLGLGTFVIVSILLHLPTSPLFERGFGGLFATWVAALAYALALFDEELPWWKRGLLLILVAAWGYRQFFLARSWLSGWLPLGVACAAISFMRSKKLFLVLALVGVVYVGRNFDYYYQSIYVTNANEGGLQRLDLWRMNLQHVANHPLFGMGPAGYAVYNMTYHPWDARSTHNNYFDILAQTGIVGSAIFLWLFATLLWMGHRVRRALAGRRNFEEAFVSAALGGCIAALVAMMLGDWVIPFAYNATIAAFDHASYTWIFLGGMVSLYHIVRARSKSA